MQKKCNNFKILDYEEKMQLPPCLGTRVRDRKQGTSLRCCRSSCFSCVFSSRRAFKLFCIAPTASSVPRMAVIASSLRASSSSCSVCGSRSQHIQPPPGSTCGKSGQLVCAVGAPRGRHRGTKEKVSPVVTVQLENFCGFTTKDGSGQIPFFSDRSGNSEGM